MKEMKFMSPGLKRASILESELSKLARELHIALIRNDDIRPIRERALSVASRYYQRSYKYNKKQTSLLRLFKLNT